MTFSINPAIPVIETIDIRSKKSIIKGWNSIISQLRGSAVGNTMFAVRIVWFKAVPKELDIIIQTHSLWIVGLQGPKGTSIITDSLNDTRYLSGEPNGTVRKSTFIGALDSAYDTICITATDAKKVSNVVNFFLNNKNSANARLLILLVSEAARNQLLQQTVLFMMNFTSFNDVKWNLSLKDAAEEDAYRTYTKTGYQVLNWHKMAAFAFSNYTSSDGSSIITRSLTITDIRKYYTHLLITKPDVIDSTLSEIAGLGL